LRSCFAEGRWAGSTVSICAIKSFASALTSCVHASMGGQG
jgi:hypothetical protein